LNFKLRGDEKGSSMIVVDYAIISINLCRKTPLFLAPLNLLLKASMGLRQFFCTSGNLKKTSILNPTVENYPLVPRFGISVYYLLPLTIIYNSVNEWMDFLLELF